MLRTLLVVVLCLSAAVVQARCNGKDVRAYLSDPQRAALQRKAGATPYGQGNHWIATRGTRTIHIVGTMHVNDHRLNRVMRNLRQIIPQVDAVLLEVSPTQAKRFWTSLKGQKDLFVLPGGTSVHTVMSTDGWQNLTDAAQQRKLNPDEVAKLQPWLLSMLLTGSSCGPQGMFASNGLDNRIEKVARRNRIPIGSLETVESAIRMLSRRSLADQVRMLEFDLLQADNGDNAYITTREAYFDQDMAAAMILEKWRYLRDIPGSKATRARLWRQYENDLLSHRNRNWIPVIRRTSGNTLFVAVGAAHLPGKYGVVNLLRQAGYKMQRAAF